MLWSLQEWDYAYVHSFYHLSLAVSFVLLLPKKNRYAGTGQNAAKLTCFTLCCCVCYIYYYLIRNAAERGSFWSSSLALIVFPNWSLFSPCPLVAPKRTQTSQRSPLRSHPGPCGRSPLRNCGNEEAAAPPCLSTTPRPPRPSKAPASASLKR